MSTAIDPVKKIEVFIVNLSQDVPYLGPLREGETTNSAGYFVRKGNRTVYPRSNRSLAVRITTENGVEGWGETYGLVAPLATAHIINDLLSCFINGCDPFDAECIHDELYDLMRVRGYTGGFYLDALAAVDIALWDIAGKMAGLPIYKLLGGRRHETIPGYVSGLPGKSIDERRKLANSWQKKGFDSFKFALPVADDGAARELAALREELGGDAKIACDLHWSLSSQEAVNLAREMAADHPWFLEAPVA
ncbi:MAG: enolase C-terminal domain-like protein, partial [Verrucomicrobiales bacterium]|nr:enolase C-terminal domain-like protein [Verrucomicrobiales bacterium]